MVYCDRPKFGILAATRSGHRCSKQLQEVDVRLIVEAISELLDQLRKDEGVAGVRSVLKGTRPSRVF